jgi:hypothetical protein
MQAKQKNNLSWFEPAWSYHPRIKKELAGLCDPRMWTRIVVITVATALALAFAVKRRFPDLEFDWTAALLLSVGACALMLASFTAILWWVPPMIQVNDKGISRQQGQHVHWRRRVELRHVFVDATDPIHPFLTVESARAAWRIGVPQRIEKRDLIAFLRRTFPELLIDER